MDTPKDYSPLLDRMPHPAFCVRDGVIACVNQAAKNRMIQEGSEILPMLLTGADQYASLTEGILCLTLQAGDLPCCATVMPSGPDRIFLLEDTQADLQLQAMSLAALHLRSPMTGLVQSAGKLSALLEEKGDSEALSQLSRMNRSLHQILRMVSNMSDAARYVSSTLSSLELMEAGSLFGEIFQKVSLLASSAGYRVRFSNLEAPVYALLDSEKLERAVYNLLSNAMKYAASGSEITAQLSRQGDNLLFSVKNDGDAIADSIRSDLFCRYSREPSLEDGRNGIGLGMALVRIAAAVHNGTVLATQDGQSVCITMRLSLQQPSSVRVSSPVIRVDYAGELSHCLIELSDVLPPERYLPGKQI